MNKALPFSQYVDNLNYIKNSDSYPQQILQDHINTHQLYTTLTGRETQGRETQIFTHTNKERDTLWRRNLYITFQHKESDFDKWLFWNQDGSFNQHRQTNPHCVYVCVAEKKALPWIKTEALSQQHDKPIYCRCFEKLTGLHTCMHTHTCRHTQCFWLSIISDPVYMYSYAAVLHKAWPLKSHKLQKEKKT